MEENRLRKHNLARRNVQKFMRNRLALTGLSIVTILILASVFAPLLTKYDPILINIPDRFLPPSAQHWLGTDRLGRDLLTRLMYGGRVSIFVGFAGALMAYAIGITLGCIGGYFGGKTDTFIVYVSEIFQSVPQTLLILIFAGLMGPGIRNLLMIFAIFGWTGPMRLVRSRVLSLKQEPFVESCVANGISRISIMFRHLLPNTLGPVTVGITLSTAGYMLTESALSFLGLGVPAHIATWGNIINAAKGLEVMQNYPIQWVAPGMAISLFILGINFFGDGLRDVFDPTQ